MKSFKTLVDKMRFTGNLGNKFVKLNEPKLNEKDKKLKEALEKQVLYLYVASFKIDKEENMIDDVPRFMNFILRSTEVKRQIMMAKQRQLPLKKKDK